jgi:hypothetical protein
MFREASPLVFALLLCAFFARAQDPSSQEVSNQTVERRGVEAVIWGMPAVNYDLMYQAALRNKAQFNQVVFWSRLPSWKNQTLTPNPDAIYFMPFFDTKEGPVVLEIPPTDEGGSINGSIDDCWQTAVEDVGPAGFDKGKGGKFLILPPDRRFKVPGDYTPLSPDTFDSYAILRSILQGGSEADVAKAVAYGKRIKVYPLSAAPNPPATTFVDVVDEVFDSTIPYDLRFFQSLDRIVQFEPWLTRDKVMIDMLKSIGIEKGKSFSPNTRAQDALKKAASDAHAWIEANYPGVFIPPFNEGTHWALPASKEFLSAIQNNYEQPDSYPVDARGITYSIAFFSAKHLGAGQFYLMTINDKNGNALDGSSTYRLNVPANAPVKQFWSATVYDRATHALIRDLQWSSRSSLTPGLQKNADGSADVYFAPKAPAGKESNWVPTSGSGQFEVLFRFYGPEKSLFDKTWKLPDIEKTN